MSIDDRELARSRLVELQNALHDRRARVAELTRQMNLLPPMSKHKPPPRIPHSKLRVQIAAICGLLSGYAISRIGDDHNGRAFGVAATLFIFVVVNWFVSWPPRFGKPAAQVDAPTTPAVLLALEQERRACDLLEIEIRSTQRLLGSAPMDETA